MSKNSKDQSGRRITALVGSVENDKETDRSRTMTIEFRTPAEAFAAVAWVVCTADKLGSMKERDFLYEHVQNLGAFKNYSLVEFQFLLGATFN